MDKFIYTFNPEAKEKLLSAGFVLIKEDTANSVYIFLNNDTVNYALSEISYITSNSISF